MWEHKSGEGIWSEYINSDTGESSINSITPKTIKVYCKPEDHYFVPITPESRECICSKCGQGAYYVLGLQYIVDGKIVNRG
jgi:hypothetical protein